MILFSYHLNTVHTYPKFRTKTSLLLAEPFASILLFVLDLGSHEQHHVFLLNFYLYYNISVGIVIQLLVGYRSLFYFSFFTHILFHVIIVGI